MIKVAVTQLKAPWPAGAVVGSIVGLAVPLLPSWAAGKCTPLAEDDEREAEFSWTPPEIDHSDPQARTFVVNPAAVAEQLQQGAARIAELEQLLADAEQALGTARAEIASLVAERDAALQRVVDAAATVDAVILERDAARADLQAMKQATAAAVGSATAKAPAAAPAVAPAAKTAKRSTAA